MYSQHDEEKHIVDFFKGKKGRFLDIGAYDGHTLSNTQRLVELGWTGVCVEASPRVFKRLEAWHKDKPVKCVQAVVTGAHSGKTELWETEDLLSTVSHANMLKWRDYCKTRSPFVKIETTAMSIEDLLTLHPGPYEFVNIDTEGTSEVLACCFPYDQVDCKLVCIEHDNKAQQLASHLSVWGFRMIAKTPENVLLGR